MLMSLNYVFSEQGHPKVQCATQGEILLGDSGDGQNLAFLGPLRIQVLHEHVRTVGYSWVMEGKTLCRVKVYWPNVLAVFLLF